MADPDLHTKLRSTIEERLALAQAATPGPWHIGDAVDPTTPCNIHAFPSARGVADAVGWLDAEHIAANSPDRVIRACRADLDRLQRHAPAPKKDPDDPSAGCLGCGGLGNEEWGFDWRYLWPCPEVRSLAEVWLPENET